MKNLFIILTLLLFTSSVYAEEFLLSTPRTSLLLTGEKDGQLYLHYFGRRVLDPSDIWNSGNGMLYREAIHSSDWTVPWNLQWQLCIRTETCH